MKVSDFMLRLIYCSDEMLRFENKYRKFLIFFYHMSLILCVSELSLFHCIIVSDVELILFIDIVKISVLNDDCIIDLAMVLSTCLLSYVGLVNIVK